MIGQALSGINSFLVALLVSLIRLYKRFISPMLGSPCRFYPTCSTYAIQALETHGVFKGLALTIWRLLRCGPWSDGGFDPVPPKQTKNTEKHL